MLASAVVFAIFWLLLGYLIPAALLRICKSPLPKRTRKLAAAAVVMAVAVLLPTIAWAAPWYEREPWATPFSYVLGAAAATGVAWLGALVGKKKKLDIAAANRAAADALEKQLQNLMLQAISAIEEQAARSPVSYKSKDKRIEAIDLFQKSLPKGVSVPRFKAETMLDALLATSGRFGAASKKAG